MLGPSRIVWTLPQANATIGIYATAKEQMRDPLNDAGHRSTTLGEPRCLMFGLAKAGLGFCSLAAAATSDLFVLGSGAPIGLTAALFMVLFTALFMAFAVLDLGETSRAEKMGALFFFGAAATTLVAGRVFSMQKVSVA